MPGSCTPRATRALAPRAAPAASGVVKVLAIDPSICDLGYALFELSSSPYPRTARLVKADCIKQPSYESVEDRSDGAANALALLGAHEAVIELPDHYSSAKGAAARNSDSILKLMFQVATIRATLMHHQVKVILVPVRLWKGTQKKHITQRRVLIHWGFADSNHNIADAVGIGDWLLRKKRGYRPIPMTH